MQDALAKQVAHVLPVSVTYVFKSAEGNVGEPLASQLTIKSHAHKVAHPVTLSSVRIEYDGPLKSTLLTHESTDGQGTTEKLEQYVDVDFGARHLGASTHSLSSSAMGPISMVPAKANLTFFSGQTKIFNIACLSREAGDAHVKSVTLSLEENLFDMDYIVPLEGKQQGGEWWTKSERGSKKRRLGRESPGAMKIRPRPPRMQMDFSGIRSQYYTDEKVTIEIEVRNEEDEDTEASLGVRILGDFDQPPLTRWNAPSEPVAIDGAEAESQDVQADDQSLPGHQLGRLQPSETTKQSFSFVAASHPVEYVIEVKILYHQVSDPETPVAKTITTRLPAISPFEMTYDFSPRVHQAPWPSYFHTLDDKSTDTGTVASGLTQKWVLSAMMTTFAEIPLYLVSVELQAVTIDGEAVCSISKDYNQGSLPFVLTEEKSQQIGFNIDVQKMTLDDRRTVALDFGLTIDWKRAEHDLIVNSSALYLPRLLVHGGEPRVLASVQYSTTVSSLIHLDYTIENPSIRLLTFSIVMESNEEFAFYGPKAGSLQLVPISRHTLRYNLFPTVQGTWIQPQLKVVDRYFSKTLKVSATEGMKMDKKGILVWVNAEG